MNNSRRDFVVKSTLTLAALVSGYKVVAINPSGTYAYPAPENNTVPKICLFSKALQDLEYPEMIPLVAEMGFAGIDLTVRAKGHVLPENVTRDLPLAVAEAKNSGINIDMLTTDILEAEEPFTEDILKTAASLGIKHYRMGRAFYDEKKSIIQNLAHFKLSFKKLAKLNRKYDIRGEYQNHSGGGFGAPVWDLWEVLKNMDPRWIGVQYDLFHAVVEGANSWPLGFNLIAPYIGTIDIKDFYWKKENEKWDQALIPLGEGMVDFKKFITLLKEKKIPRIFSIHCEYLSEKDDLPLRKRQIKKDLLTLQGWLHEAGC